MVDSNAPISKAHIISNLPCSCILVIWTFENFLQYCKQKNSSKSSEYSCNFNCNFYDWVCKGIWTMPITHRLVFAVVFGWTAITSIDLLIISRISNQNLKNKSSIEQCIKCSLRAKARNAIYAGTFSASIKK